MEMICLDTNVLIEILKNNQSTISKVTKFPTPLYISSITAMELIYGARNKKEVKQLQLFIAEFEIIELSTAISKTALNLVLQFAKSNALDIPDALIAACCLTSNVNLFTYNLKDFRFIPKLNLIQ